MTLARRWNRPIAELETLYQHTDTVVADLASLVLEQAQHRVNELMTGKARGRAQKLHTLRTSDDWTDRLVAALYDKRRVERKKQ